MEALKEHLEGLLRILKYTFAFLYQIFELKKKWLEQTQTVSAPLLVPLVIAALADSCWKLLHLVME